MADRLEAMAMLVAVVETGSLSAASRKLGVPLPTLSRKLSELEAHLTTRLLARSTRRLTVTDAGATYVTAAKRILEDVAVAERAASGEYMAPRGELVIAAPVAFGRMHVLPVVGEFLSEFPDVDVQLSLSDRNVHLLDDHVDVAVRIGALPDQSSVATRVGQVRQVVCGSPTWFEKYGTPNKPADLSGRACVSFDYLGAGSTWLFRTRRAKRQSVQLRSRLSVNTAQAAVDATVAGVGVTRVFSYQVADAVAQNQLQIALADFEAVPLPVHLLHAAQGRLPLKLRAFLDFAAPRLRERLLRVEQQLRPSAAPARDGVRSRRRSSPNS